eukprot:TRINITY_DN3268_c0_g1_i1.p1 TRINITY_DN3268_c0_g1~~TRINITY_DN3268_c0_g1_i1.p1  ORF type:complete len:489 (+),score=87.52 TRINITY_DN3268_c0_g1_i1:187-1653(+)
MPFAARRTFVKQHLTERARNEERHAVIDAVANAAAAVATTSAAQPARPDGVSGTDAGGASILPSISKYQDHGTAAEDVASAREAVRQAVATSRSAWCRARRDAERLTATDEARLVGALKIQRAYRARKYVRQYIKMRDAFRAEKTKQPPRVNTKRAPDATADDPEAPGAALATDVTFESSIVGGTKVLQKAGCTVCLKAPPDGRCGRCRGGGHVVWSALVGCTNCTEGVCNNCGGCDWLPENERIECSACNGSGDCRPCAGRGTTTQARSRPCVACGGDGMTTSWHGYEELQGGGHNAIKNLQFKVIEGRVTGFGQDDFGPFSIGGAVRSNQDGGGVVVAYTMVYDPIADMDDVFHYRGVLTETPQMRCGGRWTSGDMALCASSRLQFHLTGFEDRCKRCDGQGSLVSGAVRECPTCPARMKGRCRKCAGKGWSSGNTDCPKCDGGVCSLCLGLRMREVKRAAHCSLCDCTGLCPGCSGKQASLPALR